MPARQGRGGGSRPRQEAGEGPSGGARFAGTGKEPRAPRERPWRGPQESDEARQNADHPLQDTSGRTPQARDPCQTKGLRPGEPWRGRRQQRGSPKSEARGKGRGVPTAIGGPRTPDMFDPSDLWKMIELQRAVFSHARRCLQAGNFCVSQCPELRRYGLLRLYNVRHFGAPPSARAPT